MYFWQRRLFGVGIGRLFSPDRQWWPEAGTAVHHLAPPAPEPNQPLHRLALLLCRPPQNTNLNEKTSIQLPANHINTSLDTTFPVCGGAVTWFYCLLSFFHYISIYMHLRYRFVNWSSWASKYWCAPVGDLAGLTWHAASKKRSKKRRKNGSSLICARRCRLCTFLRGTQIMTPARLVTRFSQFADP